MSEKIRTQMEELAEQNTRIRQVLNVKLDRPQGMYMVTREELELIVIQLTSQEILLRIMDHRQKPFETHIDNLHERHPNWPTVTP